MQASQPREAAELASRAGLPVVIHARESLDDVKEQFAMTANAKLTNEDRELGLITWPEFQHFVRMEILPAFGKG